MLRWTQDGKRQRKKADTRSWAEAEQVNRELEDQLNGRAVIAAAPDTKTLRSAIDLFIKEKQAEFISTGVEAKYVRELARLASYCEGQIVFTVQGLTRELMTGYAATWERLYPSSQTRSAVRTRCRGFLRYCYEAQWLPRVLSLPKITADETPTLPLTREEYERLLAATETVKVSVSPVLARALIQLMGWSGLAIRDALTLRRDRIVQKNIATSSLRSGKKQGPTCPWSCLRL